MADETLPYDDDDAVDEGNAAPQADTNKSFAELRKAYNREEKARKALEKEVEDLRTFKSGIVEVQTQQAINSVFTEVGLNPKHADLFKAVNKEITPEAISKEAVAAFAAEYELVTNSGEAVEAPEEKPAGFTPVTTGTGPGSQKLDAEGILEKLRKGDLEGLNADFKAGRVQRESVPWARYQG
jgi:hypothetical protein